VTDIVDAEVVEPGTDLVPAPQSSANLFRTDDPVQMVEKATQVANALRNVISAQGLFTNVQGKAHVNVEGWQLLGSMLGVTAVCTHTEAVDGGYKAHVEARTLDGRVIGAADAVCTKHERRGPWKNADDYARLSMAQTRATSKALKGPLGFVVNLAGYATTPAEEMTFAEPDTAMSPASATPATSGGSSPSSPSGSQASSLGPKALASLESLFLDFIEAGGSSQQYLLKLASIGVDATPEEETGAILGRLSKEQGKNLADWFRAAIKKAGE
jgi:hypothetical protein